jgi:hypothetical protein
MSPKVWYRSRAGPYDSACIRQHTSAYVSLRQIASWSVRQLTRGTCLLLSLLLSLRRSGVQELLPERSLRKSTCLLSLEPLRMCAQKRHRNVYRLKRGDFGGLDNADTAPGTHLIRCQYLYFGTSKASKLFEQKLSTLRPTADRLSK